MSDLVRVALSLALVVLVFLETGWATALCIFLICLRAEIQDFMEDRTFQ